MSTTFISQLYRSLLGREADEPGVQFWAAQMQAGAIDAVGVTQAFVDSVEFDTFVEPIARLYFSAFNRVPDADGLAHWVGALRQGATITEIAEQFVQSSEYQTEHASLSDRDYIESLYQRAFGRDADSSGLGYWLQLLESGMPRTAVLTSFAQSEEMIALRSEAAQYSVLYLALTGTSLPISDLVQVLPVQSWASVIQAIYTGPNYQGVDVPGFSRYVEPEPRVVPEPEPEPEPEPDSDSTAPTIVSFTAAPPATLSVTSSEPGTARLIDGTTVLVSQSLAAADTAYTLPVSPQLVSTSASLEVADFSGNVATSPIQVVLGTTGNDTFSLSGVGQRFLFGFDGDDRFEYGLMSEFLEAGAVRDFIVGGAGENSIRLLDTGPITIVATDSFANVSDVETLVAMAANTNAISLALNADAFAAGLRTISLMPDTDPLGTNLIDGSNAASDQALTLYGSSGSDSLIGGAGADILDGGVGADTLEGGVGNDVLEGDDGADELAGGDGNDTFVYGLTSSTEVAAGEVIDGGNGSDTIWVRGSTSFANLTTATLLTAGSIEHVLLDNSVQATFLGSQLTGQAISINTQDNWGNAELRVELVGTPSVDLSALTFTAVNGGMDYSSAVTVVGDAANNTVIAPTQVSNIQTLGGDDDITSGTGAYSIDGGQGNDVFRFTDNVQLRNTATVIGGDGTDTIAFSNPVDTLTQNSPQGDNFHADFDKVSSVERIALTGANKLNLGDVFPTAGINTIVTGDDDTTLRYDTTVLGTLAIDVVSLADNKALTLTTNGPHVGHLFDVTNLKGNVDATGLSGAISVTAATGSGFDVVVTGGDLGDTIDGGDGNDSLQGGLGNDSLRGGAGDDSIVGGEGNDTLLGNAGDDVIYGNEGDDGINAGQGNDTVYGGVGNDTILGGSSGDDVLYGEQGDDSLNGADGNDTLNGGDGADTLLGGAGNDVFVVAESTTGGERINGGSTANNEVNTVMVMATSDLTNLLSTDSTGTVGTQYNLLTDGAINQIVLDGDAADVTFNAQTITGQAINFARSSVLDTSDVFINVSAGTSRDLSLLTFESDYRGSGYVGFASGTNVFTFTVTGGVAQTDIVGTSIADVITGEASGDTLSGGAGNDTINGGDGNDTITGGAGADSLTGGSGADTFVYNAVFGSSSDSHIDVNTGVDRITDLEASDVIQANLSNVNVFDATSADYVVTDQWAGGWLLILDATGAGGAGSTDLGSVRINIDNYNSATAANQILYNIVGTSGNDTLVGGSKADTIDGGDGNDHITGGYGADVLNGGNGDDRFYYRQVDELFPSNALIDAIDGGTGTNALVIGNNVGPQSSFQLTSSMSWSGLSNVSRIEAVGPFGAQFNLALADDAYEAGLRVVDLSADTSTSGNDNFINVSAESGSGNGYSLIGSTFRDIITGGAGNDSLNGGAGSDTLTGGVGEDVIDVGSGVDRVVVGTVAAAGVDVVTGFTSDDKIGFVSASSYVVDTNNLDARFSNLNDAIEDVVWGWSGNLQPAAIGFTFASNTYVVIDGNSSKHYEAASDAVVQLIGTDLSTLSAANFVA